MTPLLTDPQKHRWLFVTGCPRSGTTFLGDMLSQPITVNPLIEPFNPHGGMPWVHQRYLYYPALRAMDSQMRANFEDFFAYRFKQELIIHVQDSRLKQLRKRLFMSGNQLAVIRAKLNPVSRFTLIKDPIAVFLTDVFLEMRPMSVFALVRHPLSYAGSLKRLGWNFEIDSMLDQPELRERYLYDFGQRAKHGRAAGLEAAAWIWLAINRYLVELKQRHPEVDLLFHEEMSKTPLASVRRCYARAGLPWDMKKEAYVRDLTEGTHKETPRAGVAHDFKRKSDDIFRQSVALLSDQERDEVLRIVEPLAEKLYGGVEECSLTPFAHDLMALA